MRSNESQTDKVYRYLKERSKITSAAAIGTFGITRLAAVIPRVRKKYNVEITANYFRGANGSQVAEYSLV